MAGPHALADVVLLIAPVPAEGIGRLARRFGIEPPFAGEATAAAAVRRAFIVAPAAGTAGALARGAVAPAPAAAIEAAAALAAA